MQRVMVLGGGSSQFNLLRRARQLGLSVVLADRNPAAPGRRWCNEFAPVSTFDQDGITAAAAELGVHGIIAVGTDQPVLTAAVASQRLGLPYPLTPEVALSVTNKRVMKRAFSSFGVPTAPYAFVGQDFTDGMLANLAPPYVVKPVDSQGQRGIIVADTVDQVRSHLPTALSFSRESEVIVEQYYPSEEVTVSGWVHEGRTTIFAITDRVTVQCRPSIGVCVAHRYPNAHDAATNAEIIRLTELIVDRFAIAAGPIYFQMLVGAQGVWVNEVACRLGGAYEDESLPALCGVDLLEAQLRLSTGRHADPAALRTEPTAQAVAVPLVFCEPGTVERFGLPRERAAGSGEGAADYWTYLLDAPVTIEPLRNSTQRAAYAVIHGCSAADVNARVRAMWNRLGAWDAQGRNLIMNTLEQTLIPGTPA